MKFYYAKGKEICKSCNSEVQRNDIIARVFIKNKESSGGYTLTYHLDCYILETLEHIRSEACKFVSQHEVHPKAGRPCKYTDSKKAANLMNLRNYYRKQGNTTKLLECERELCSLVRTIPSTGNS